MSPEKQYCSTRNGRVHEPDLEFQVHRVMVVDELLERMVEAVDQTILEAMTVVSWDCQ
jgi:hypothetical protein